MSDDRSSRDTSSGAVPVDGTGSNPDEVPTDGGHTPGEVRSEPDEGILVADNLVAGYIPGVPILNGCTLVLGEGELIGIVGPNGAGKSTLVKAIFGLVSVTSGQVRLRGEDITSLRLFATTGSTADRAGRCRGSRGRRRVRRKGDGFIYQYPSPLKSCEITATETF